MKRTKQSTFAKRERKEKATGFAPVASEEMNMAVKPALTKKQATSIARKFVAYIHAHDDVQWTPDLLISFLPMDLRALACEQIEQSDCHPITIGAIANTVYGLGRS